MSAESAMVVADLRDVVRSKDAEIARLRAALELARPVIDRLEYIESCADDGFGERLQSLRFVKNAIQAAIIHEQKIEK